MTASSDYFSRRKMALGYSLVGLLSAVTISGALIVTATNLSIQSQDDANGAKLASYQLTFARAAEEYLKEFQPTTSIDVALLKSKNYLPADFENTNVYGQRPCLRLHANRKTAIVVAEGGRSTAEGVRNRASAIIGPGTNYINAGFFNGANIDADYPTPCQSAPRDGSLAIGLTYVSRSAPGITQIHRLPYLEGSNQMLVALDMNRNNLIQVGTADAQQIQSKSLPADDIVRLSSNRIDGTSITVAALSSSQFINTINSSSMTVARTLTTQTININQSAGSLSTGTLSLPSATTQTCGARDSFAQIDGLPHVCKAGLWQPIQLTTQVYQSGGESGYADHLDWRAMGCSDSFGSVASNTDTPNPNGQILLGGGGSVRSTAPDGTPLATQNLYFEPTDGDLFAKNATLYASNGNSRKTDFYIDYGPGKRPQLNPKYQRYPTAGELVRSTSKTFQLNSGLDTVGLMPGYANHEKNLVSGTSIRNEDGFGDEAGDSIRNTVICGRLLGVTKNR